MEAEDFKRIEELVHQIAAALGASGVDAIPNSDAADVWVQGWLTDIVGVYLEWRSEIDEELG